MIGCLFEQSGTFKNRYMIEYFVNKSGMCYNNIRGNAKGEPQEVKGQV